MIKYSETVTLVIETCIDCGTPFGMEATLNNQLRRNGRVFYCPNGHTQVYAEPIEKRMEQLKNTVKTLEADKKFYKEEAERKARQLSATKGVLTRTKNRIAKGVCPCCHRQFIQMARHMQTKHPDYLMEPKDE